MPAKYIVRLDDACPTMKTGNWNRMEALLDAYNILPVVAVIPNNQDKKLFYESRDEKFWDKVNAWQQKGWVIALHGYDHFYSTKKPGLVPINKQSEFAGVDPEIQKDKIKKGWEIFKNKNIKSNVWIAPSHSFDKNTLLALREVTDITIISDGIAYFPFKKYGFSWVPQQLWEFKKMKKGIWTCCFHPNIMTDGNFNTLQSFLEINGKDFISVNDIKEYRAKTLEDNLLTLLFYSKRFILKNITGIARKFKGTGLRL